MIRPDDTLVSTNCPHCGYELAVATPTEPGARGPQQGDGALCIKCGEISEFDDKLQLVKPSPERLAAHKADAEMQLALRAWKDIEPARKARGW